MPGTNISNNTYKMSYKQKLESLIFSFFIFCLENLVEIHDVHNLKMEGTILLLVIKCAVQINISGPTVSSCPIIDLTNWCNKEIPIYNTISNIHGYTYIQCVYMCIYVGVCIYMVFYGIFFSFHFLIYLSHQTFLCLFLVCYPFCNFCTDFSMLLNHLHGEKRENITLYHHLSKIVTNLIRWISFEILH